MAQTFKKNNDEDAPQDVITIDGSTGKRLKSFIERIERLEEEKAALASDIKDVYGEAKAIGFDPKIMRKVIRLRKLDEAKRSEEEMLIETYKAAIGMV